MGYLRILNVLWLVVLLSGASAAQAAPDPREMSAREAFGAGRYQDALELFAKLYAENLNPVYLRNIGRCYQNLSEPDRAISSFREYMRKGKNIKKAERAEIEGYISEMEALKKTQEAERNAAAKTAPPATTAVATGPPAGGGPTETKVAITERDLAAPRPASPPPAIEMSAGPAPEAEESHPVYARWWFWAIVGGVVAAGVGGAAAAGVFTKKNDASCMGICK